jgi:hypothetical protein
MSERNGMTSRPLPVGSLTAGQIVYTECDLRDDPWEPDEDIDTSAVVVEYEGRFYAVELHVSPGYITKEHCGLNFVRPMARLITEDSRVWTTQEGAVLAACEEREGDIEDDQRRVASARRWVEHRRQRSPS